MIKPYTKDELIHLINILPESEILVAKKFLEFLVSQSQPLSSQVPKDTIIDSLYGICSPFDETSKESVKDKRRDYDSEDRWKERISWFTL